MKIVEINKTLFDNPWGFEKCEFFNEKLVAFLFISLVKRLIHSDIILLSIISYLN